MSYAKVSDALKQYKVVDIASGVDGATPHHLVTMLMEGALSRISAARGHMQRNDVPARGENISLAISIIGGLKGSLDLHNGGEIASNLDALYDYMVVRLFAANRNNEIEAVDEVRALLREIKEAWDGIPDAIADSTNIETLQKQELR